MAVIEVRNVSKSYPARQGTRALLGRGGIFDRLRGRHTQQREVLSDISFELEPGASLGIIGRNGSGKSTLLKMLAGVTLPTHGSIAMRGRVASLLELGAGFHPMLTGRENVYLNAGLLGMRHASVDRVFDQIVAFSGIGDFIDQPVDTYSSGMYVRIAFSVAAHANPDIFLVDEVLAVGDEAFQRQCRAKIGELRAQGKTIVFVSHDLGLVHALCDRVVLLSQGRMITRETPQAAIDYYLRQVGQESGIHTFRGTTGGRASSRAETPTSPLPPDTEAIFSHGRISLFLGPREVTSAAGLYTAVLYMGQYHGSEGIDWHVTQRTETSCVAEAPMPRLPARWIWEMHWEGARLHWRIALECSQPVAIERIFAFIYLPFAYDRWWYGARDGEFPEVLPAHTQFARVIGPDTGCCTGALAASETAGKLPPVIVDFQSPHNNVELYYQNAPYTMGSRVVEFVAQLPHGTGGLPAGCFAFCDATIDLGHDAAAFAAWLHALAARYTVRAGALAARMNAGAIELAWNGVPLSTAVHLHVAMYMHGLWCLSQGLPWDPPMPADGGVRASAQSPRLPFRMHWLLAPEGDDAVRFTATLDIQAPIGMQEYNVALGLADAYDRWVSPTETGAFPPFHDNEQGWRHLNRDYSPGAWLRAESPTLPGIQIETSPGFAPFQPSALNTSANQAARVLQAICTPGPSGVFDLQPGNFTLFDGVIRVVK